MRLITSVPECVVTTVSDSIAAANRAVCLCIWSASAAQDPVAAVAAAPSRRARQAAAAAAALTHHATAVVAGGVPARLLAVSADDLRRFGRRVRGPLAKAAAVRREWLAVRLAAVQVSWWGPGPGGLGVRWGSGERSQSHQSWGLCHTGK